MKTRIVRTDGAIIIPVKKSRPSKKSALKIETSFSTTDLPKKDEPKMSEPKRTAIKSVDVVAVTSYRSMNGRVHESKNAAIIENTRSIATESLLKFFQLEAGITLQQSNYLVESLIGESNDTNSLDKIRQLQAKLSGIIAYYENESNIKPGN